MDEHKNMLIIGDSFVEGVGGENTNGWAQMLAAHYPNHDIVISGEGGDTTKKLIARWPENRAAKVLVQIGTNDSRFRPSMKSNEISESQFKVNLNTICKLSKQKNHADQIYFVGLLFVDEGLTVPYKEDKIYKNFCIRKYDDIIRAFCTQNHCQYVSISDFYGNANFLWDGLHPSPAGHHAIFSRVSDRLLVN